MRFRKKLAAVLSATIILFVSTPLESRSTNIIYTVSISAEAQYMSEWCWAACARMAGKTMYNASSRSQFAVVNLLKGDALDPYPNVGGFIEDGVAGSKYVAYYHRSFDYYSSIWGFTSIQNHISQGKPVQTYMDKNVPGGASGSHALIIYGTAHAEDSSGSHYYIAYIDPIDGATHYLSYSEFCNSNAYTYRETIYVSN